MLTTVSLFTTVKMKSLATLTTLFQFTITNEISDYGHHGVFTFTTIKMNSLTTLTMLFYVTTLTMISLTTLTTLFYYSTTNPRDHIALTTQLLSLIHQIGFPQEYQSFHKICMCHSNFTVRKFSGALHGLLPK